MNGSRVEEQIRARSASGPSRSRLFHSFRGRGPREPLDSAERIGRFRRQLERAGEGTAEAAEIHMEIGRILSDSGRETEALDAYQRGLRSARSIGDHRLAARALVAMGMVRARRREHAPALEFFFEALREGIDAGDSRCEAAALMEIASVHSESGRLDLALESLERSIALLENPDDAYLQARARIGAGSVLVALSRAVEAIDHAVRGLVALEWLDDEAGQIDALIIIGRSYRQLGELETAAGYLERGLELARARMQMPGVAASLFALAEVRRDQGRLDDALAAVDEAMTIALDARSIELEWRVHELAAELCEQTDSVARALGHTRSALAARDVCLARRCEARVDELRVRHETLQIGRERDALRTEAERLRGALAETNRQLTAATLSLVRKSELLDEVRQQLGGIVETTVEHSASMVRPILDELAVGACEESWGMFEQQFDSVHNDFTRRLAERYPALTPMELKVSMLTRIDLSAKEIAHLLHVSERNVQNHRYRLRKKLGLSPEENLATFLAGI
jgi:tetratricopeptide (TPR) repeat protein/DNA-binding CsgD family transcriptional regulator